MRRFALVFFLVVFPVGVAAVGASPAFAGPTDWAVNGVALQPGQETTVKFVSTSPVQLIVPGLEIHATCTSWKAKGKLVGGETGTGELLKPKFGHCTEPSGPSFVKVKIKVEKIPVRTDIEPPPGAGPTTEFTIPIGIFFRKGGKELEIAGMIDTFGPDPGEANVARLPPAPAPREHADGRGQPGGTRRKRRLHPAETRDALAGRTVGAVAGRRRAVNGWRSGRRDADVVDGEPRTSARTSGRRLPRRAAHRGGGSRVYEARQTPGPSRRAEADRARGRRRQAPTASGSCVRPAPRWTRPPQRRPRLRRRRG